MNRRILQAAGTISLSVSLLCSAAETAGTDGPTVVHRYVLGGDGGWDYLNFDPDKRRLFITRGEHVMVVAADSGTLVGDITGTKHAHAVGLVAAARRGF